MGIFYKEFKGFTYTVDEAVWGQALELFRIHYISKGPYKSNVPKLVREITNRLMPGDSELFARLILSEVGARGGRKSRPSRIKINNQQKDLFS